jgi:periplasmic protein TonB
MGGDNSAGVAREEAVARRSPTLSNPQDRRFWIGLACALAAHIALIVGVSRSSTPRQMGEPEGHEEGVSVDVVDAAELNDTPAPVPITPPRPLAPAAPPLGGAPPAQKDTPPVDKTDKDTDTAVALPDATPEQAKSPIAPEKHVPEKHAPDKKVPDKAVSEKNGPEKNVPEKTEKQRPREPSLSLNLQMPDVSLSSPDRSAAVSRPEGVTRSGENDDFGRAVIRALRQTMPNQRGMNGRITVRLFLSESGNLLEVRVIRSGGDPLLDQNVVFAVKQTNFPIPPVGSVLADRTFLVTYIYR